MAKYGKGRKNPLGPTGDTGAWPHDDVDWKQKNRAGKKQLIERMEFISCDNPVWLKIDKILKDRGY